MGTTGKALTLLNHFTQTMPEIGLSDLARLAKVNKATVYRLMSELAEAGLVEQVAERRTYRIGPAALRLAALREAHVPTREAALPTLRALAEATGETAHLSHLVAGRLTTLAFAYGGTHGVRVMMEDADVLPLHATASGHAVLAFSPEDLRQKVLSAQLQQLTGATPTDPHQLADRIARVRDMGFAEASSTFEAEVHGLAVPLFGRGGGCIGAVAVATPVPRMTPDLRGRITAALARAGGEISRLWGGQPPASLARLWLTAE